MEHPLKTGIMSIVQSKQNQSKVSTYCLCWHCAKGLWITFRWSSMSCIMMYEVFLKCFSLLSRPFSRHSHGADPPGEPDPWGVCHLPWPPYWPVQARKTRVWPGEQVQAFQRYRRPFYSSCFGKTWVNTDVFSGTGSNLVLLSSKSFNKLLLCRLTQWIGSGSLNGTQPLLMRLKIEVWLPPTFFWLKKTIVKS